MVVVHMCKLRAFTCTFRRKNTLGAHTLSYYVFSHFVENTLWAYTLRYYVFSHFVENTGWDYT